MFKKKSLYEQGNSDEHYGPWACCFSCDRGVISQKDTSADRGFNLLIPDAVAKQEGCDAMFGLILSCVRDGVVSVRNKLTSDDDSTYYIDTKSIFCLYSLSRIFGKIVLIQQLA